MTENDFMHLLNFCLQGCYDQLEGYLTQNGILIGTAAVVVGVFMVSLMVTPYVSQYFNTRIDLRLYGIPTVHDTILKTSNS